MIPPFLQHRFPKPKTGNSNSIESQQVSEGEHSARSTYAAHKSKNGDKSTDSDPDLTYLIDAWPNLPKAIKEAILTMVSSVSSKAKGEHHER